MFCTGCGKMISDTDKFCKICGTKNIHYKEKTDSCCNEVVSQEENEAILQDRPEPPAEQNITESFQSEQNQIISENATTEKADEISAAVWAEQITPSYYANPINTQQEARQNMNGYYTAPPEADTNSYKQPQKSSAGRMFASVLLSILAFAVILVLILTIYLKNVLSEKTITTAAQQIDYTGIKLGEIMAGSNLDLGINEEDTATDIIYDALSDYGKVDISRSELEEIIENSTIPEYISKKIAGYLRYAVTGDSLEEVTPREIVNLVKENKRKIEKVSGLTITSDDLDKLETYFETDGKEYMESLSEESLEETLQDTPVKKIKTFLSDSTLIIIMIASVILLIVIILLLGRLHKGVSVPLKFIGIPVLLCGIIFLAAMLTASIIKTNAFTDIKNVMDTAGPMISEFIKTGFLVGAITLAAGIILLLCSAMIKKLQNRNPSPEM